MSLTAREWLLLPQKEQESRKNELPPDESFLLRTDLGFIHFSEEEKKAMTKEEKEKFIHPHEFTDSEIAKFSLECSEIFKKMSEEVSKQK